MRMIIQVWCGWGNSYAWTGFKLYDKAIKMLNLNNFTFIALVLVCTNKCTMTDAPFLVEKVNYTEGNTLESINARLAHIVSDVNVTIIPKSRSSSSSVVYPGDYTLANLCESFQVQSFCLSPDQPVLINGIKFDLNRWFAGVFTLCLVEGENNLFRAIRDAEKLAAAANYSVPEALFFLLSWWEYEPDLYTIQKEAALSLDKIGDNLYQLSVYDILLGTRLQDRLTIKKLSFNFKPVDPEDSWFNLHFRGKSLTKASQTEEFMPLLNLLPESTLHSIKLGHKKALVPSEKRFNPISMRDIGCLINRSMMRDPVLAHDLDQSGHDFELKQKELVAQIGSFDKCPIGIWYDRLDLDSVSREWALLTDRPLTHAMNNNS